MTEKKWLLLCQRHIKIQQAAKSMAGQRPVSFPALQPSGRPKWVWAPARKKRLAANGKPNALLAPALSKKGLLIHPFTLQRLIFISSGFHPSSFIEAVPYFCRSRSQWRRNVVGGSFRRSAALRILPYRS